MYQKSSALSIRFECEEVSLQIEFTALPPKNHNLFVKSGTKRELEKRNCGHRLIMHSITRMGGGGDMRREWGGGGWVAPLHKLIYEPGEIV